MSVQDAPVSGNRNSQGNVNQYVSGMKPVQGRPVLNSAPVCLVSLHFQRHECGSMAVQSLRVCLHEHQLVHFNSCKLHLVRLNRRWSVRWYTYARVDVHQSPPPLVWAGARQLVHKCFGTEGSNPTKLTLLIRNSKSKFHLCTHSYRFCRILQ